MPGWMSALRFLGVGVYVGASIFLGVYLGSLLDARFDTAPTFTLIGLFLGLAVAGLGVYRMLKAFIKEVGNDSKRNDK